MSSFSSNSASPLPIPNHRCLLQYGGQRAGKREQETVESKVIAQAYSKWIWPSGTVLADGAVKDSWGLAEDNQGKRKMSVIRASGYATNI